jgi:hypothetical protein
MAAQKREASASVVDFALRRRAEMRVRQRMMRDTASSLCCTKQLKVPREIVREPWTSHISLLYSYALLRRGPANLRPRPITFVSGPLPRRTGSSLYTMKWSRRFFRTKTA